MQQLKLAMQFVLNYLQRLAASEWVLAGDWGVMASLEHSLLQRRE